MFGKTVFLIVIRARAEFAAESVGFGRSTPSNQPTKRDNMGERPTSAAMSPEGASDFRRWQYRILVAALVGYALYYFVRKNLSVAMPAMETDLRITKKDLG